jgi:hypothetical protein
VEKTVSIRASLQYALDHWKPGQTTLSAPAEAILDRSNSGSFGVTHAAELQQIGPVEHQGDEQFRRDPSPASRPAQVPFPVPITSSPSSTLQTQPGSLRSPLPAGSTSPSINPAVLNNEPAVIPSASPPAAVNLPGSVDSKGKLPAVTPTVAETGVPVSGGPGGPGPSCGSLRDIRPSPLGLSQAVSTPVPEGGSTKQYESAEEEKRRLAREERERLLHGDVPSSGSKDEAYEAPAEDGETPPPYQDI